MSFMDKKPSHRKEREADIVNNKKDELVRNLLLKQQRLQYDWKWEKIYNLYATSLLLTGHSNTTSVLA